MIRPVDEFDRFMPQDKRAGFAVKRLPKSGIVVIELDYWADPEREGTEWIAAQRALLPAKQVAVEIERSWETFAGKGVYDKSFYKNHHILLQPVQADLSVPLLFRGWDFGGNQSVIICQLIGPRLYVLDELPNAGTNTRAFAPEVIAYCAARYGNDFEFVDIVDPSAQWEGKTSTDYACTDVMRELGLSPIAATTNDPQKRIDAVTKLLMRFVEGKPCLQINPHCTTLIKGFDGGYHYPEKLGQRQRIDRPVKNLFSHIHDSLQYVCLRIEQHSASRRSEEISYERSRTTPRYKFN